MKVGVAYKDCMGNLEAFYPDIQQVDASSTDKQYDLIIFTGGEDVSPEYYHSINEGNSQTNRQRDDYEAKVFWAWKNGNFGRNCKLLGICRGSQFLSVMLGGRLIQDLPSIGKTHYPVHKLEWRYKSPLSVYTVVNSLHHQAADPKSGIFQTEVSLLAVEPVTQIPEIWVHKCNKILGCQPHPEFFPVETGKPFFDIVNSWCKDENYTLIEGENLYKNNVSKPKELFYSTANSSIEQIISDLKVNGIDSIWDNKVRVNKDYNGDFTFTITVDNTNTRYYEMNSTTKSIDDLANAYKGVYAEVPEPDLFEEDDDEEEYVDEEEKKGQ